MEYVNTNHNNMLSCKSFLFFFSLIAPSRIEIELFKDPPPPINGSPVHHDTRVPTQFTPTLPPHQTLASPSFPTPTRQPLTSPLSGWDNDRQDRPGPSFQNPQMTVQQFQTASNDRQTWQQDTRMTLNGHTMGSADPSTMRQVGSSKFTPSSDPAMT